VSRRRSRPDRTARPVAPQRGPGCPLSGLCFIRSQDAQLVLDTGPFVRRLLLTDPQ
jgi:hypothetical protein